MKKLKSFSSVTVLWCVSYFLLLAVFVFSTAVMFGLNRSVINKINSRYCQTILEEINENAIQEINKTRDMYSAIVNFPDIDNILAIGSFDGYYSSKAVLTLLKDLSVIVVFYFHQE